MDENEETSQEAGVQAMPTFQVYKNRAKVRTSPSFVNRLCIARVCASVVG